MTVRRSALNAVIFLALASSATPAAAGVRALAPGTGAGPALLDGQVFWGEAGRVVSSPVRGGPVSSAGDVPAAGDELVAGSGSVSSRSGVSLFATGGGSAFARVLPDAGAAPLFGIVPSIQPTDFGLAVLEGD